MTEDSPSAVMDKAPNQPSLSVVTSLYKSAEYIDAFCARTREAVETITGDYEIILVNDGSPDESLQLAIEAQKRDPRISIIDLSRNFGQHRAILTGLAHASGDHIFIVEADLEESPEWVIDFYELITSEDDLDVVYGQQKQRYGSAFERSSGALFYRMFNLFSEVKMPENHLAARLISRRYAQALLEYREKALFLGGVYELVGFNQRGCVVEKSDHSETTYTLRRKLGLLVDAITSFSTLPLWLIFWVGMFAFILAMGAIGVVTYRRLFLDIQPGWTGIVASIWAVGGLLMLSVGVIGLYLRKVMMEVKGRPTTTIKQIYVNEPRVDAALPGVKSPE